MSFFDVFSQMLVILFAIGVGFAANRMGILNEDTNQRISRLLLTFTVPAMIVASVITGETLPPLSVILSILMVGAIFYGLEMLFVLVVPRIIGGTPLQRGVWSYVLAFPNVAFIGYPVVVSLFGQEALFYAAILCLPFNLLTYTIGAGMLGGGSSFHWKQLLSPCTVTSVLALVLALARVRPPALVGEMLAFTGDLTVPLSLLLVGSLLAGIPMKQMLGGARVWIVTALRLLVLPVLLSLILGAMDIHPMVVGVAVTQMAMPAAINGNMLCMAYGGDSDTMAQVTFITTAVSIVTIPLIASILL